MCHESTSSMLLHHETEEPMSSHEIVELWTRSAPRGSAAFFPDHPQQQLASGAGPGRRETPPLFWLHLTNSTTALSCRTYLYETPVHSLGAIDSLRTYTLQFTLLEDDCARRFARHNRMYMCRVRRVWIDDDDVLLVLRHRTHTPLILPGSCRSRDIALFYTEREPAVESTGNE